MTTKTSDVPRAWQRRAARRAVEVAYGYLAAFFVLGVLFQVYLRESASSASTPPRSPTPPAWTRTGHGAQS